jgi:hypothetical protein
MEEVVADADAGAGAVAVAARPPLRTAAQLAAARAAVEAKLAEFAPGVVRELTAERASQLSECRTLAQVMQVLPLEHPWQLVLLSRDSVEEMWFRPTLHWACFDEIEAEVMAYLLTQPCMKLPWALEEVPEEMRFYDGVPEVMYPDVGRGLTPLLACIVDGKSENDLRKCDMLLAAGACLTARSPEGMCVLHLAVVSGYPAALRWAIAAWVAAFPEPGSVDQPRDLNGCTARNMLQLQLHGPGVQEMLQLFPQNL